MSNQNNRYSNIILFEDINNINNNNNNNNNSLMNNISNIFQDLISVDMNIENVKNKKIKYENNENYNMIQQDIIENIRDNNDIYLMLKLIENKIFENLSEKIQFIKKNYLKIDEYDILKETKDLKHKMSDDMNNKFQDIVSLYDKFKKSDKNEISNNIENYVDTFEISKKRVNDYEVIMNLSKNYLKYINDKNVFDFDIIKHIENQKKIVNECIKKNKEFDELILDIRKTLKKYNEWNTESNKYLSLIKNIQNDVNKNKESIESEKINIYNVIKNFNETLYNDDLILIKIKNAINLKIELDYCFSLICKYGSKVENNLCSICYNNKISCCYVPCGHTYCLFCAYTSPTKCMNCREQNVKIQKIFL